MTSQNDLWSHLCHRQTTTRSSPDHHQTGETVHSRRSRAASRPGPTPGIETTPGVNLTPTTKARIQSPNRRRWPDRGGPEACTIFAVARGTSRRNQSWRITGAYLHHHPASSGIVRHLSGSHLVEARRHRPWAPAVVPTTLARHWDEGGVRRHRSAPCARIGPATRGLEAGVDPSRE